ncbi:MAG: GTP cyclohydrolase II [Candidatus Magasanikbacteria bacterium]|nr:GTP cyclohydrolase II [Candidatus Magasanikbacteria bacterium]
MPTITLPTHSAHLPTPWGIFDIFTVSGKRSDAPHVVLIKRPNNPDFTMAQNRGSSISSKGNRVKAPPLVRIHSECFTGDILGSLRCDCGEQLHLSLKKIGAEGGILIYLRQEGRGSGLVNKLKAYQLQDQGLDTVEAQLKLHLPVDDRDYADAATILKKLGFTKIRLLTNNPEKIKDLTKNGITVTKRLPLGSTLNIHNRRYLETKKNKLGHLIDFLQSDK